MMQLRENVIEVTNQSEEKFYLNNSIIHQNPTVLFETYFIVNFFFLWNDTYNTEVGVQ